MASSRVSKPRVLALVGLTAASLCACNAITGLGDEYHLAGGPDASPDAAGPAHDSGATDDGATGTLPVDDAGEQDATDVTDAAPEVDAGQDANVTNPTDAGLCGNGTPNIVFCTDFENASADAGGPTPFGLKEVDIDIQSAPGATVRVADGVGSGGSRGLAVALGVGGTAGRRAVLRIHLGPAKGFQNVEATFDMALLGDKQTVPSFSTLGALAVDSLGTDYGVGLSAGQPATLVPIYGGGSHGTKAAQAVAARLYRVRLKADRVSSKLTGTLVEVTVNGTPQTLDTGAPPAEIDSPASDLELALGVYNASADNAVTVHFDNIVVTATNK